MIRSRSTGARLFYFRYVLAIFNLWMMWSVLLRATCNMPSCAITQMKLKSIVLGIMIV